MEFQRIKGALVLNQWLGYFFLVHVFFAVSLGRIYVIAPDEVAYISTFNQVYTLPMSTVAQSESGWITAPTVFLWIVYFPAKVLNMTGVPDYLSVRILSILITSLSLYIFLNIQKGSQFASKFSKVITFAVFFIPSIFLWSSIGLRESFIIAELAVFMAGFNFLMKGRNRKGILLLFIGSYGLVSTKNYLWACLIVTLILCSIVFLIQGSKRRQMIIFIIAGFIAPLIAFAATTSPYALNFILHSNISEVGARSGDSITQVYVDSSGAESAKGSCSGSGRVSTSTKQLITFHGDSTMVALHCYITDNPEALFTKISKVIHLDRKIQSSWEGKVAQALANRDNSVGSDDSSLNEHILEPGKMARPWTLIWPAFIFLFGPFPFIGDPGIVTFISSLESPLWWVFYAIVIFQFVRFRRINFLQDPQIFFTLVFLAGEIAFSALIEVNLGTSFRHRSILLVPLLFLYVRLAQRAEEQKDLKQKSV